MVLQGRPPTPTKVLEARGSWRAKNRKDPVAALATPVCPAWLQGEARKEWNRVVKDLRRMKVLCSVDKALLVVWAEGWAEYVLCSEQIRKAATAEDPAGGLVGKGSKGNIVPSVWVKLRQAAIDRMMHVADRFGFSPVARARLRVEVEQPGEEDPLAEFRLGGEPSKARFFAGSRVQARDRGDEEEEGGASRGNF